MVALRQVSVKVEQKIKEYVYSEQVYDDVHGD
jgi:hypothetical protein